MWDDDFATVPNVRRGTCQECGRFIAIARSTDLLLEGKPSILVACNPCSLRHVGSNTVVGSAPGASPEFQRKLPPIPDSSL
jgi:hypothetical protein